MLALRWPRDLEVVVGAFAALADDSQKQLNKFDGGNKPRGGYCEYFVGMGYLYSLRKAYPSYYEL